MPVRCPDDVACEHDCGDTRDPLCVRVLCADRMLWPDEAGARPLPAPAE